MNRPTPISVFSDQRRTKSTTWSRTSCGTQLLVRVPQDFFLTRCAPPSARPGPRPWSGPSSPRTQSVSVSLPPDGRGVPWIGRRPIRSRRTPSANGRTPWAANPVLHKDRIPAPCPEGVVSGWQLSPRRCNACARFSYVLRILNGRTFSPFRTEAEQGRPVSNVNELEYVRGDIYANIWHTDEIVRISPRTGKILGRIDLTGLMSKDRLGDPDAVFNGIAYASTGDRLFVTGKLWPTLFEIKVVHQVHQSQDGRGRRPHRWCRANSFRNVSSFTNASSNTQSQRAYDAAICRVGWRRW